MPLQIVAQIVGFTSRFLNFLLTQRNPTVYRPEKCYMRGPGPQWHAEYARVRR